MKIILDTNILWQDFTLNSKSFKALLDFNSKTMSTIVLPEIVIIELLRGYQKELETITSSRKRKKDFGKLRFDQKIDYETADVEDLVAEYERYFRCRLNQFHELPIKNEYLKEIYRRYRSFIKPFGRMRNAFNDTAIWLSIIDFLDTQRYDEVIFISDNKKDFGDENKDDLHPDLMHEVKSKKVDFKFYRSLQDFILNHVAPIDFITYDWLIKNIDWEWLDAKALYGVNRIDYEVILENFALEVDTHCELSYWEMTAANYQKEIDMFCVNDKIVNDFIIVELYLSGNTAINYTLSNGRVCPVNTHFSTWISLRIKFGEIIDYTDNYYPEETMLDIRLRD